MQPAAILLSVQLSGGILREETDGLSRLEIMV